MQFNSRTSDLVELISKPDMVLKLLIMSKEALSSLQLFEKRVRSSAKADPQIFIPQMSNYENVVRPTASVCPSEEERHLRRHLINIWDGGCSESAVGFSAPFSSLLTHSTTSTQGQVQFSFSSAPKPTTDAIVNVDGFWQPPRFYLSIRSFENVGKIVGIDRGSRTRGEFAPIP